MNKVLQFRLITLAIVVGEKKAHTSGKNRNSKALLIGLKTFNLGSFIGPWRPLMRSIICLKALLKLDSSGTEANSGNQILDPDKIWKKKRIA